MTEEDKRSDLKEEMQCANIKYQSSLVLAVIGTFTLTASLLALLTNLDFYLREAFLLRGETIVIGFGIAVGGAFSIGGLVRAYCTNKKGKELAHRLRLINT